MTTLTIDVTRSQSERDYRNWLASRLPEATWAALDEALSALREVWDELNPGDGEPDPSAASSALLDAEDALGEYIALTIGQERP